MGWASEIPDLHKPPAVIGPLGVWQPYYRAKCQNWGCIYAAWALYAASALSDGRCLHKYDKFADETPSQIDLFLCSIGLLHAQRRLEIWWSLVADDLLYVGIKKDFYCIRVYIYHITILWASFIFFDSYPPSKHVDTKFCPLHHFINIHVSSLI